MTSFVSGILPPVYRLRSRLAVVAAQAQMRETARVSRNHTEHSSCASMHAIPLPPHLQR
jgi:hypothetical protein